MENSSEIKPVEDQNLAEGSETVTEQPLPPANVEGGSPVSNGENATTAENVSPVPEVAERSLQLNPEIPSGTSEDGKNETEAVKDVKPKKKKKKAAQKPKTSQLRRPKRIVVGKDVLTDEDFEFLRNHIRMTRLKVIPEKPIKKFNSFKPPKIQPTMNRSSELRIKASKEKMIRNSVPPMDQDTEKMKKILKRVQGEEKKKIKQTRTTKLRWMKIRNMPIFSEYFKENFYQYGKPPYAIPMKYVPFNMLWEADWVKNPYEWEDEQ